MGSNSSICVLFQFILLRSRMLRQISSLDEVMSSKRIIRLFGTYMPGYLQGGSTKQGIRSALHNCGKNADRFIIAKQGRPDSLKDFRGKLTGCEFTDEIVKKLEDGVRAHLLGTANRNISIPKAFKMILFDAFRIEVERDGKKELVFCEELPTEEQFRGFLNKNFAWDKRRRSRLTSAGFGTTVRSKLSESRTLVPRGPGDIYQIDSTTVDMYIVAENGKRKLLARVTLYLVVDVWSRYIAGFHLTHGNACYEEAVLALLSVLEDRQEMCKRFGVPYDPEDWAAMPLPATLIGDRQECIYANSDLFAEMLGIHLTNPPPYRGDYKGFVEAAFHALMKILWSAPGGVDTDASKDEEDYRLNAIYTFSQLRRMLFLEMIRLNRRFIATIPVPREAMLAEVPKVPVKLATWGLENISGMGLNADLDTVRRALLPVVNTSRTAQEGIRVSARGVVRLIYRVEPGALPEKYFEKGGSVELKVQSDSRSVDVVWVTHPETQVVIPAFLSEVKCSDYLGMTWSEALEWQQRLKEMKAQNLSDELAKEAAAYDLVNQDTAQAIANAVNDGPVTRSEIIKSGSAETDAERKGELNGRTPIDTPATDEDHLF
jgi:hypothetical protein